MKAVAVAICLSFLCSSSYAGSVNHSSYYKNLNQSEKAYVQKLAKAIYMAEGVKAKYPYGVIWTRPLGTSEAKTICENTIARNLTQWKKNRKGDFISYLGSSYCPTSGKLSAAEKKLNKHWVANTKFFMERV